MVNTGYYKQFKSIFPFFALSVSMGGIVYLSLLIISNIYLQLFLGCLIGVAAYLFLSKLFNVKEFNFLLLKLKN